MPRFSALRSFLALPFVLLTACSPGTPSLDQGLAVHQSVIVAGTQGEASERRLLVLEDARLTEEMRYWMLEGSKDPAIFLDAPNVVADAEIRKSFAETAVRRGLLRLVDRDDHVLMERRLDCELGEMDETPLAQGMGEVWAIADDCSTGDGFYAGPITRFFTVADDKIQWQSFIDPKSGEKGELTLVQANRLQWHTIPPERADMIVALSCHPDFDDPAFKTAKPDAPLPANLPLVLDYIRYRYDGKGGWIKTIRTEKGREWSVDQDFPDDQQFP